MIKLLVTLCFINSPCEVVKLQLFQSETYCQKAAPMEMAKAASSWPDGFTIKRWDCK